MRHFNFEKEDTGFEILISALAESTRGQHRPWPLYFGGKRVSTRFDRDEIHVRYGCLYSEKKSLFRSRIEARSKLLYRLADSPQ
jgi:hypothetical protein